MTKMFSMNSYDILWFYYDYGGIYTQVLISALSLLKEMRRILQSSWDKLCFSKPGKWTNQFAFWIPQRMKTAS